MPQALSIELGADYQRLAEATDERSMMRRFAGAFASRYGTKRRVERCYVPRVSPLKNGGFVIQYELTVSGADSDGGNLILWGKAPGGDLSEEHCELTDEARTIVFPDIGLCVLVFPFDPKLPLLEEIWGGEMNKTATGGLRFAVDDTGYVFESREILGYRLERRCTMRGVLSEIDPNTGQTVGGKRRVVLKLIRPKSAARAIRNLEFLDSLGLESGAPDGVSIPKIVFTDQESGVIVSEAIARPSLHDLLNSGRFATDCAGKALSRLHRHRSIDLPERSAFDELHMLRDRVGLARRLFPLLAESFKGIYEGLERNMKECDSAQMVVCHGDFFDKQLLVSDGRVAILDCDSLAHGDPAWDIGNFLAHIHLRGLQNPTMRAQLENSCVDFLSAYGKVSEDLECRVRWWRASSLLRLAVLYGLRPRWRHLPPALLEEATRELNSFA